MQRYATSDNSVTVWVVADWEAMHAYAYVRVGKTYFIIDSGASEQTPRIVNTITAEGWRLSQSLLAEMLRLSQGEIYVAEATA